MKLFSILPYCATAPELETLPTSFPLLLNTGVGKRICIVIYKHCKTLLGPTCINLVFALAFFFCLASLQHSFCLCSVSELCRNQSPAPESVSLCCCHTPLLLRREGRGN